MSVNPKRSSGDQLRKLLMMQFYKGWQQIRKRQSTFSKWHRDGIQYQYNRLEGKTRYRETPLHPFSPVKSSLHVQEGNTFLLPVLLPIWISATYIIHQAGTHILMGSVHQLLSLYGPIWWFCVQKSVWGIEFVVQNLILCFIALLAHQDWSKSPYSCTKL